MGYRQHHDFYDRFAKDLALRVVERYFGRKVAEWTDVYIEHQGKGWIV